MIDDDERERYWRGQLAELERRYRAEAEPIIRELVRIEARKPPAPIFITPEQMKVLQAQTRSAK